MNLVIRGALVLAAVVSIWTILLLAADVHQKPELFRWSIPLMAAINVIVVYVTLRKTAATQVYRQQLASGALLGAIAGVLIAMTSWLTATVLFPAAIAESSAAMLEYAQKQDLTAAQMSNLKRNLAARTPFRDATQAAWGTLFTSIIAAAVVAIGARRPS